HVLERHDEDARLLPRLCARGSGEDEGNGNGEDGGNGQQQRNGETENRHRSQTDSTLRAGSAFVIATVITQAASPVPRHATTSARALTPNSASRRVNAAA